MAPISAADHAAVSDKFSKARALSMICWPFTARIVGRFAVRWTDHPDLQTMGVDRNWRLYVSREYVSRTPVPEIAFTLAAHEFVHAFNNHSERLLNYWGKTLLINGQEMDHANVAHDIAIGSMYPKFIESAAKMRTTLGKSPIVFPTPDKFEIPELHLMPSKFRDSNNHPFPELQVSEVYAKLLESGKQAVGHLGIGPGKCVNCGSGAHGRPMPWEDRSAVDPGDSSTGTDPQTQAVVMRGVAEDIVKQASSHPGTVPGHIERMADVLIKPAKVNWRKILPKKLRSAVGRAMGQTDFSYTRPSRRFLGSGSRVIFPSRYTPVTTILYRFDTSGSMCKQDLETVFSECYGLMKAIGQQKLAVQAVDAEGYKIQWVSNIKEVKITGGGGTKMMAGLEWAAKTAKAKLVVICTDGMTSWGPKPPGLNVLVILTRPVCKSYPPPEWADYIVAAD